MSSFFQDLTNESTIDADFVNVDGQMDITDATIIGSLIPDEDNVYDIGDATHKWANIYFGILNTDVIDNATPNVDLTLQATHGVAHVKVNDDLDVVGNLEVQGTTEYFLDATFDQNVDILGTLHVDAIESRSNDVNLKLSGNGTGIVEVLDYLKTPTLELTAPTNQLIIQPNDSGTYFIVRATNNPTFSRELNFPDVGNGDFLITSGAQTIDGVKTFDADINMTNSRILTTDIINSNTNANLRITSSLNSSLSGVYWMSQPNCRFLMTDAFAGTLDQSTLLINGNTSSGTRQWIALLDASISGNVVKWRLKDNGGLNFNNGTDYRLLINDSGNVSIGNNNDTYKLDVTGTGRYSGLLTASAGLSITGTTTFNSLTASNLVATDGSKQAVSIQYTNSNVSASVVQRDVFGEFSCSGIQLQNSATQLSFFYPITWTNTLYLTATQPTGGNKTLTIPSLATNASIVCTEETQTINGTKTLSGVTSFTNTTDSTSTSTGAIVCTGGIAVNKSLFVGTTSTTTGIKLNNNTASYTPAVLNYYEEYSASVNFTSRGGSAGAVTIKITRVGNNVTMVIPNFTLTSGTSTPSNTIQSAAAIPSRFRPTTGRIFIGPASIVDNAVNTYGMCHITSGGNIEFYKDIGVANYNTSVTVGINYGVSGSWIFNV